MYQYHRIRLAKDKTRDEHRLLIEELLGRKLHKDEIVHHINGDPRDNRIENLQVMSRSDHARHHFPNGHRPSEAGIERLRQLRQGKPNYSAVKCNSEQIENIILMKSQGLSERQISRVTGIARGTVNNVLAGRSLCYQEYYRKQMR